jgi:hypothetical protein
VGHAAKAVEAVDFGVMGEVFPILEQNLIEVIITKAPETTSRWQAGSVPKTNSRAG